MRAACAGVTLVMMLPLHTLAEEAPGPLLQAFFGSLQLDDQVAGWDDISGEPVSVEFPSSLPSGGIEAEYRYGGGRRDSARL